MCGGLALDESAHLDVLSIESRIITPFGFSHSLGQNRTFSSTEISLARRVCPGFAEPLLVPCSPELPQITGRIDKFIFDSDPSPGINLFESNHGVLK